MPALRTKLMLMPLVALTALVLAGCSGGGSGDSSTAPAPATAASTSQSSVVSAAAVSSSSRSSSSSSSNSSAASASSSSSTVGPAGITLRWNAPTHNSDGTLANDIKGYVVHYGVDASNMDQRLAVNSAQQLSALIAGLTAGKTYYFAVATINSLDVESELSATVTIKA